MSKKILHHKATENTMKCIHVVNFKEKDFEETIATTPEEITKTWERRAGKIR